MQSIAFAFFIVAALWSSAFTLMEGYKAVNMRRDMIITGLNNGAPLSVAHRKLIFRNDWIPMKYGLGLVSLVFSFVIISSPILLPPELRSPVIWSICGVVALVPMFSAFAWIVLGVADQRYITGILLEEEKRSRKPMIDTPSTARSN